MKLVDKTYLEEQFSGFWTGLRVYLPNKYAKGGGLEFSIVDGALMVTQNGTTYKVCDLTQTQAETQPETQAE